MKKNGMYNLIVMLFGIAVSWGCSDDKNEEQQYVTVNPLTLTFAASGNELTQSLEVKSNSKWTAVLIEGSGNTWISTDVKEGRENSIIQVTVLENTGTERKATLKLTAGSVSTNVEITQNGIENGGGVVQLTYGTPKYVGPDIKLGESFTGKVVIPYQNATGLEHFFVSISATGNAAAGFNVTNVSQSLMKGNGDLEISVTGTPEVAGSFTYVIAGVEGLTTTTIAGTVVADNSADLNTLIVNSSYKDVQTVTGWIGENVAVQQGGDKDYNPMFKFIGNADNRAVCLNGKTSAVGSLVSPTLTGGCGTLNFKYGIAFGETNGVSVKIEIKQNGVIVKTFNLIKTKDEITPLTAYSYSINVNVTDNFGFLITNNSPSAADADKDCVSIFDITWTNNKPN